MEGHRLTDLPSRHNEEVQEEQISCRVTSKRIRGKRLNSVDTRAQCPGSKHANTRASDTVRVTQ